VVLILLGYALYFGLQAAGVDPLMAGNFTQLIIFIGLCVGWVGTYVFRVANKVLLLVHPVSQFAYVCLLQCVVHRPNQLT
jgi:hypothetical protein